MGKKQDRRKQRGREGLSLPLSAERNRDLQSATPETVRAIFAARLAPLIGHDPSDDSRENLQQVCSERHARTVIEAAHEIVPVIEATMQAENIESRVVGLGQMTRLVCYAEQLRYALSLASRSSDQVHGLMKELRQSLGPILLKPEKLVSQAVRPDQAQHDPREIATHIHTLLCEAGYEDFQGIGQIGAVSVASEVSRYLVAELSHAYLGKQHNDVLAQERLRVAILRNNDIDYLQDVLLALPDRFSFLRPNSFFQDIHGSLRRGKSEGNRLPYVQAIFDEHQPKHRESLNNYRALMSASNLGVLSMTLLNNELMFAGLTTQPVPAKDMQRYFQQLQLSVNGARRARWEQAQAITDYHAEKVYSNGSYYLALLRKAVTDFKDIKEFTQVMGLVGIQATYNLNTGPLNDPSCELDVQGHPIPHVVELVNWKDAEVNQVFPELPELRPETVEAVDHLAQALAHDIERSRDPYESDMVGLVDEEHRLFIGAEPRFPETELTLIAPEHILKVKLDQHLEIVGAVPPQFQERLHLIRAMALAYIYDQIFAYSVAYRLPRPVRSESRASTPTSESPEDTTDADDSSSEVNPEIAPERKLTMTPHYLVINEGSTDAGETDYRVTEKDHMLTLERERRSHWMELEAQTLVLPARQYAWESVKGQLQQVGFLQTKIERLEQILLHTESHLYPASQIIRSVLQPRLLRPGVGSTELDSHLTTIIDQFEYLERRTYWEKFNQVYDLSDDGRLMQRIAGIEERLKEKGIDPKNIPPYLRPSQTFRKGHPVEMHIPIEGGIARKQGVYTVIRANTAIEALLVLLTK